jgi:hypothetical protein
MNQEDDAFIESNLMHSINGYVYGNLPLAALTMKNCHVNDHITAGMQARFEVKP